MKKINTNIPLYWRAGLSLCTIFTVFVVLEMGSAKENKIQQNLIPCVEWIVSFNKTSLFKDIRASDSFVQAVNFSYFLEISLEKAISASSTKKFNSTQAIKNQELVSRIESYRKLFPKLKKVKESAKNAKLTPQKAAKVISTAFGIPEKTVLKEFNKNKSRSKAKEVMRSEAAQVLFAMAQLKGDGSPASKLCKAWEADAEEEFTNIFGLKEVSQKEKKGPQGKAPGGTPGGAGGAGGAGGTPRGVAPSTDTRRSTAESRPAAPAQVSVPQETPAQTLVIAPVKEKQNELKDNSKKEEKPTEKPVEKIPSLSPKRSSEDHPSYQPSQTRNSWNQSGEHDDGTAWGPQKPRCQNNPHPVFTADITDVTLIDHIVPPGIQQGHSVSTNSQLVLKEGAEVPIYMPVTGALKFGSFFAYDKPEGEYFLQFELSCEVDIKLNGLDRVVDKLKNVLPETPSESSAGIAPKQPVTLKAGELIGYISAMEGEKQFSFGLFNNTRKAYSQNMDCPYDYYPKEIGDRYRALFDAQGGVTAVRVCSG